MIKLLFKLHNSVWWLPLSTLHSWQHGNV